MPLKYPNIVFLCTFLIVARVGRADTVEYILVISVFCRAYGVVSEYESCVHLGGQSQRTYESLDCCVNCAETAGLIESSILECFMQIDCGLIA